MDRAPLLNGVRTSVLEIAYEESGPPHGAAVLLMHGFPYDPRTYDDVVPSLAEAGCRVIVPYLRGYGPTKFLAPDTLRSGQQAALGNDLKELMDALALKRAMLAGYDWGGRGACIVAALWPERVRGLVSANGYNIQDIAGSAKPAPAEQEYLLWLAPLPPLLASPSSRPATLSFDFVASPPAAMLILPVCRYCHSAS